MGRIDALKRAGLEFFKSNRESQILILIYLFGIHELLS